jgi:hypothetical protein
VFGSAGFPWSVEEVAAAIGETDADCDLDWVMWRNRALHGAGRLRTECLDLGMHDEEVDTASMSIGLTCGACW